MNYSIRKGLLQAIDTKNLWIVGLAGKYLLIFLGVILYTLVIARASDAKAARKYEAWQERYVNDFLAQRDAEAAGMIRAGSWEEIRNAVSAMAAEGS